MISESTPNNTRCIPYTPATFGPSPVFGGGGGGGGGGSGGANQETFSTQMNYGYGAAPGPGPMTHSYNTPYPPNHMTGQPPPPQEPPQMMGPLGPINPVELLAQTDTSFFKNQLNSLQLNDGQTEFHIPKEMVLILFSAILYLIHYIDGLSDWPTWINNKGN